MKEASQTATMSDDGSASDWSTSGDEARPREQGGITVEYKGTEYVGTSVVTDKAVPDDIVCMLIAPSNGKSARGLWCRDPGNGVIAALSRGECRKLAVDIVSKSLRSDAPTAADIVTCGLKFGTPFPVQLTWSSSAPSSQQVVPISFKYCKQVLVGVLVPGRDGAMPTGVSAVDVDGMVYWIVGDDGSKIALTVTEARKAFKTVVGRPLTVDGPTREDESDCTEACGFGCAAQLYDAKTRNDRAKAKRTTTKDRTTALAADIAPARSTPSKRSAVEVVKPSAKRQAVTTSEPDEVVAAARPVNVSVTFSGDAATLLPFLSAAMSP